MYSKITLYLLFFKFNLTECWHYLTNSTSQTEQEDADLKKWGDWKQYIYIYITLWMFNHLSFLGWRSAGILLANHFISHNMWSATETVRQNMHRKCNSILYNGYIEPFCSQSFCLVKISNELIFLNLGHKCRILTCIYQALPFEIPGMITVRYI